MSEPTQENAPAPEQDAEQTQTDASGDAATIAENIAPAEDADNPGAGETTGGDDGETGTDDPAATHRTTVTDLPDGAEVDPLTDTKPEPVQEAELES